MSTSDHLDDAEKAPEVQVEDTPGQGTQQVFYDHAAEKRVVRKLDLHVVPLVMGLCEHPFLSLVPEKQHTESKSRSPRLPGPLQHRVDDLPLPGRETLG